MKYSVIGIKIDRTRTADMGPKAQEASSKLISMIPIGSVVPMYLVFKIKVYRNLFDAISVAAILSVCHLE